MADDFYRIQGGHPDREKRPLSDKRTLSHGQPLTDGPAKTLTFGSNHGAMGESSTSRRITAAHDGPVEDSFFLSPAHQRNPFTIKIHELEDDPGFRRAQREYAGKLDDSPQAKFSKFAIGSGLGFGAYFLSAVTDSTALGIMAGAAASPFFDDMSRGVVKRWHQPPRQVRQKEALEALETETQAGKLVQVIGTEWPHLVERAKRSEESGSALDSVRNLCRARRHFSEPDETAALIGTALISRYPEQQEALKATLPLLRNSQIARKFILPALQRTHKTTEGYGACSPGESREEHEHPGMRQAVDTMLDLAERESYHLEKPFDRLSEQARYERHLKKKLPRLIDYLSEE